MTKKLFAVVAAVALLVMPIYAKTTKQYQRPSLHNVLLTTEKSAAQGTVQIADPEILGYAADSWKSYVIPALYNDFDIAFDKAEVGAAKGSIMDVLAQYNNKGSMSNMSISELKNVIDLFQGKKYREALKVEVDNVANEVAHQLIAKWWGIQKDGTYSWDLLYELACYSATQNQANDAAMSTMGAANELFNELAGPTMANTFVAFTKLDFYENEPIAQFIKNIMYEVAALTPELARAAVELGADKTYEATRDGYTAFTNALLYQLEWNDSIANEFYSLWTTNKAGKSVIDMKKFKEMKFNLRFVGATGTSETCMLKKADRGKDASAIVEKTIHRTLDKQFAGLQAAYEEFRPMVPILGIDAKGGIIADCGTKEGIKVGDKFNILEPITNEKGITKYNFKGQVKVVKWTSDKEGEFVNGVWNNAEIDNATAATEADGSEDMVGTHLSKFKNASPSWFVKRTKK